MSWIAIGCAARHDLLAKSGGSWQRTGSDGPWSTSWRDPATGAIVLRDYQPPRGLCTHEAWEPDPEPALPEPIGDLSPEQVNMLRFERHWHLLPGAKEQAIKETFGLSPVRYYQNLRKIISSPLALAADPLLVGRLTRAMQVTGRRARWAP